MPDLNDKHKIANTFKQELDDATISRPDWALDHPESAPTKPSNPAIPQSFLDAILEIIAKSIEQALAETMARCVGEAVEQKLRPLAEEVALLRIAIEHDWENANRRGRNALRE